MWMIELRETVTVSAIDADRLGDGILGRSTLEIAKRLLREEFERRLEELTVRSWKEIDHGDSRKPVDD